MNETLKTFKNLAELADTSKTEKQLIQEYQQANNDKPEIFCLMFCRYFKLITATANQFFNLSEADVASFATEELAKAMRDFDPSIGSGNLGGIFKKYLFNRLRSETERLSHKKRVLNVRAEYLDGLRDKDGREIKNQIQDQQDHFSFFEMVSTLKTMSLSTNQFRFCVETMVGTQTDSDIAKKLSISSAAIFKIKKSLHVKFEAFC